MTKAWHFANVVVPERTARERNHNLWLEDGFFPLLFKWRIEMNTHTGEVIVTTDAELEKRPDRRDWVKFDIGETVTVKGINFRVHDVSDQRLVLKFVK